MSHLQTWRRTFSTTATSEGAWPNTKLVKFFLFSLFQLSDAFPICFWGFVPPIAYWITLACPMESTVPSSSRPKMSPELQAHNASALGKALFFSCVVPSLLSTWD